MILGVRLNEDLERRLENLVQETGHSKSYYAKKALQEFLDDREDYLIGLAALERQESTITLSELGKKLGFDD